MTSRNTSPTTRGVPHPYRPDPAVPVRRPSIRVADVTLVSSIVFAAVFLLLEVRGVAVWLALALAVGAIFKFTAPPRKPEPKEPVYPSRSGDGFWDRNLERTNGKRCGACGGPLMIYQRDRFWRHDDGRMFCERCLVPKR